jgi:SAM-dependent methyltransferase
MAHKGSSGDAAYLARRKLFSQKVGPRELYDVIDHWPLYVGNGNLGRWLAIYEILKTQLTVPGDIAEFGSWRGANLLFMAKAMQAIDPHGDKKILCFDNFAGLPAFAAEDGDGTGQVGKYRGSLDELTGAIEVAGLTDSIFVQKGLIENTLSTYLNEDKGATFSLIYFDADLYEPAVSVLELGHERLAKGGVFVFDEWNTSAWPGEGLAVRSFMSEFGAHYKMEHIPSTRQPSLILRKL